MNNYHFTDMPSVLVWFFMHFKWIQQFKQTEWKEILRSQYSGKCRLCSQSYQEGNNIFWNKEVGCLHPECYDQIFELSLFMEEQENVYNEMTDDPRRKRRPSDWL